MKINYQKSLEQTIKSFNNAKPKLLLHSCCAPCSSYVLEYLVQYFKITVMFYNPNMIDDVEFEKRYIEQVKINAGLDASIQLIKIPYLPSEFYERIKGSEQDVEGGYRCELCFRLRLEEAAKYAKANNYDYFTTTLSISPLKNAQLLNDIGREFEDIYGVKYLYSDFKKKNGYKRSVELSTEYELYRQDYCGCIYSKLERDNQIK